jgi:uncharacterized protein (DUF885 family)
MWGRDFSPGRYNARMHRCVTLALGLIFAIVLPSGPVSVLKAATAEEGDARVKALADEYFAAFVQTFPLAATFMGVPDAPAATLGDNSLRAVRAWEAREDAWLARLQQVDPSSLSGADVSTFGVLKETLEASTQARVCRAELWPLNQQSGLQNFLSQVQPVGDDAKRTARSPAGARWTRSSTQRSRRFERACGRATRSHVQTWRRSSHSSMTC